MSQVAAASHAPFLSAASADMFNLESYEQLDAPRDLAKVFDTTEYARWKNFRESEDSRYVGLTAPRMLLREPFGPDTVPIEAFSYEEKVDGTDHAKYLWGNAAWALGARITQSFATYGWCATIRGVESGGLVEGLPTHTFRTESGDLAMKCPTETAVTDRREKEMADLGFIPLVHQKGTSKAAFFSVQSCQKPKVYDSPSATANARISAQLPYIFAVSRFAHYLKAMMRDKIGGYTSRPRSRAVPEQVDHELRGVQRQCRDRGSRPRSRSRRPGSTWWRFRGSPGPTGPWPSSAPTSSSTSSPCPCAWWRICRRPPPRARPGWG
jgi:type VI secretion system protein ImpC